MDLPLPLIALWPQLAAALPAQWPAAPARAELVGPTRRSSRRVWKVSFSDGRELALKLAAGPESLAPEAQVLTWLRRQGCSVPAVLAISPDEPSSWLALEWCGDRTLDDEAQGASATQLSRLGQELASALASIEAAFVPVTARLRSDGAAWSNRLAVLRALMAGWIAGAPAALGWLLGAAPGGPAESALQAAAHLALSAEPDSGSLDYHARNVLVTPARLTLLDFSEVGVDWPERRFVQYGTATGAALPGGSFASVIDMSSARHYADLVAAQRGLEVHAVLQLVDAHDVLLLLTATQQLRAVAAGTAHPKRVATWGAVEQRRARLLALLRRQLAPRGPAEELRACLRMS